MPPPDPLEQIAAAVRAGPSLDGPTRYGSVSRLLWRLYARASRHDREHLAPVLLALVDEVQNTRREIEHLERQLAEREGWNARHAGRPLPIGQTGAGVLSLYRAALRRHAGGAAHGFDAVVEEVMSDSGSLLFPVFDRFILPSVRGSGLWEPEETEFVRSRLRPGMTALNIGANVGYLTLVMSRSVGPTGLVVALEPEPLNFYLLWENLRRNRADNVLPIHAAAGERTGSATLERSPDNSGDHRTARHPLNVGSVVVPMVAMDELIEERADVSLVVIDAQGYDHRIVKGMEQTLKRCRPPLLVEFWPPGILELGDDPREVVRYYRTLGYGLSVLTTGEDVSSRSDDDVITIALDGRDHVTLALSPVE